LYLEWAEVGCWEGFGGLDIHTLIHLPVCIYEPLYVYQKVDKGMKFQPTNAHLYFYFPQTYPHYH
jgi:hypothetical protein